MIKKLLKSDLTRGSLIVFIGSTFGSFLNYLYHVLTGRLLVPESYGLLESFIIISYYLSVVMGAFFLSTVKVISTLEDHEVAETVKDIEKKSIKLSLVLWLMFLAMFPLIGSYLKVNQFGLYLFFSLQILFSILPSVYGAVLNSKLKFFENTLVGLSVSVTKIVFVAALIPIGLGLFGAMGSFIVSGLVSTVLGYYLIAKYWPHTSKLRTKINLKINFWRYSLLGLMVNLAITSIYSTDVLMVRHYFEPVQSGLYAAVSILGRIIFFATGPVVLVVFPLFAKNHDNVKNLKNIFLGAFGLITFASIAGVVFYNFFPDFIVNILYGNNYSGASTFLPWFSVFIAIYSVFNLIIQMLLAIGSKLSAWISGAVAVAQIALIFWQHESINQIITNSVISLSLGLILAIFFAIKVLNVKNNS